MHRLDSTFRNTATLRAEVIFSLYVIALCAKKELLLVGYNIAGILQGICQSLPNVIPLAVFPAISMVPLCAIALADESVYE